MIDKRKLIAWLQQTACERHGEPLTKIELIHSAATLDASQASVEEWEIRPGSNPVDLAPDIIERATDDAQALGSWQTYALLPYYGDCETSIGRLSFGIQGTGPKSSTVGLSEPANAQGLVAQLMRHTEACLRVSLAAVDGIVTQQTEIIRAQRTQLDEHDRRHVETMETTEKLLSLQHERDLATKRAEAQDRRLDQMLSTTVRLLPALAGHFVQGGAGATSPAAPALPPSSAQPSAAPSLAEQDPASGERPVSASPGTGVPPAPALPTAPPDQGALIRQILLSLKDEQLEPLQRVLTPEQQIAFLTLYQQMQTSTESTPPRSTPSGV